MRSFIVSLFALIAFTVPLRAQPTQHINSVQPPKLSVGPAAALNEATVAVSRAVAPTVVSITVPMSKASDQRLQYLNDYLRPQGRGFNKDRYVGKSIGSGVIITTDGYILTNHHVVDDAMEDSIQVQLTDGSTFYADLIGSDPSTDLAVLRIYARNLPAAYVGNSDSVQVGEFSVAVGNPFGLSSTVTTGIISALGRGGRDYDDEDYRIRHYLQTDAAINPGNSGGGLFDIRGRLIGINSAIYSTTGAFAGYGLAVPSNLARAVAEDLIEDGLVDRGLLGIDVDNLDEALARKMKSDRWFGVMVDDVGERSAADSAGIKSKDLIFSIDGIDIRTSNDLQNYVAIRRPGETVTLAGFRDGAPITWKATLKPNVKKVKINPKTKVGALGVTTSPVDQVKAEKASMSRAEGLAITGLQRFGAASKAGVYEGDVLLRIDDAPINSKEDLSGVLDLKKPGEQVKLTLWRDGATVVKEALLQSRNK